MSVTAYIIFFCIRVYAVCVHANVCGSLNSFLKTLFLEYWHLLFNPAKALWILMWWSSIYLYSSSTFWTLHVYAVVVFRPNPFTYTGYSSLIMPESTHNVLMSMSMFGTQFKDLNDTGCVLMIKLQSWNILPNSWQFLKTS